VQYEVLAIDKAYNYILKGIHSNLTHILLEYFRISSIEIAEVRNLRSMEYVGRNSIILE
jgi:hypothetical protein